MDTPDKNRIAAVSLCNFEDSPVFKYISDLSPIEPVRSIHTDHLLNSLALASPSSLFNSPQINSHRESRFLVKRHQSPDLSKSGLLHSGTVNDIRDVPGAFKASDPCDQQLKWVTRRSLHEESKSELSCEQFDLSIELPKALKNAYDDCNIHMVPYDEISTDTGNGTGRVRSIMKSNETKEQLCEPLDMDTDLIKICQVEKNELADRSDVVAFISDVAGLLDSNGEDKQIADPGKSSFVSPLLQFPHNTENNSVSVESGSRSCGAQSVPGAPDIPFSDSQHDLAVTGPNPKTDGLEERCLQPSRKQRSLRRRCLIFEMSGSHRKNPVCDSMHTSPTSLVPISKVPCPEKQSVLSRNNADNALSMPRSIGLHLNGLVNTSNDEEVVKLASGNKLTSKAVYVLSHAPSTSHQNPHDEFLTPTLVKKDLVSNDSQVMEEVPEESIDEEHVDNDMPAGKRHWSEPVEESGSCKRCNCRRSKCLKLYCDCFAAGLYCIEPCSCQDCFNKPFHEDIVMDTRRQIEARNPLAFAPKVVASVDSASDFGDENNKTPASARHKRGCNCRKSSCLKKYCECFQMGVGCSPSCRCKGCRNTFGRKDEFSETMINEEDPEDCRRDDALQSNSYEDDVVMKDKQAHLDSPFVDSSCISSGELLASTH